MAENKSTKDKEQTPATAGGNNISDSSNIDVIQITSNNNNEEKTEAVNNAVQTVAGIISDKKDENGYDVNDIEQTTTFTQNIDPRLLHMDLFNIDNKNGGIVYPFDSGTASSVFYDQVWHLPNAVATKVRNKLSGASGGQSSGDDNFDKANGRDEIPVGDENAITPFATNSDNYAVQSLMNSYSVTRLVGGIEHADSASGESKDTTFMYDIRDTRRFYDVIQENTGEDFTSITNPTTSMILKYCNNDHWGRTPYKWQDFVYLKYWPLIPNNRLITLRRYHAPTYDNLQFENMYDDPKTDTPSDNYFAPRCTVVSFFGGETGNKISDLMKFKSGIPWEDLQAKIHDVSGDAGNDPSYVIDRMFEGNGFGGVGAEANFVDKFLNISGNLTGRIFSFGKMASIINGKVSLDEEAIQKLNGAMNDPYGSGEPFENRIKGPVNRIDSVKKRKPGITFEQSFSIKTTYVARHIGDVNTKAAMLDILANCMEMVSPNAEFWGGAHRFMVTPHYYAFHDGGWRDSLMKKLYQGKIFGDDGALNAAYKGIRSFGTDENGNFTSEKLLSEMGDMMQKGLASIGSLITAASTALFGDGSNALTNWFGDKSGQSQEEMNKKGKEMFGNIFNNLNTMWRSKVLQSAQLPQIKGMGALLIGEPVGEWHLTIGNPLNPIMVIGNLICTDMNVEFSDELGPDDFPAEMSVTYTLEHGMARDKGAIQSMFNRGMGRIYDLPDYVKSSGDYETRVDKHTGNGYIGWRKGAQWMSMSDIYKMNGGDSEGGSFMNIYHQPSRQPANSGNYKTSLITKFTPIDGAVTEDINDIKASSYRAGNGNIPVIKSLAVTRKSQS